MSGKKTDVSLAYDAWARTYDRDQNLTRDLDAAAARKALSGLKPKALLELGCGTGKNTVFYARLARRVEALDFSAGMLSRARAKVKSRNVSFSLADLSRLWPVPGSSFDLAACSLVLEHIADLRFFFREAARVLRPGGAIFVCELHPMRQYLGGRARFRRGRRSQDVPSFLHDVTDPMSGFSLRDVEPGDLPALFAFHCEPEAVAMACVDRRDKPAFEAHWAKLLADKTLVKKAVVLETGELAGYLVCFPRLGKQEVGYWLGRRFWGQGLATRAVGRFLQEEPRRPLWARIAKRNPASLAVAKKCGFVVAGEDEFSATGGPPVAEWLLRLD